MEFINQIVALFDNDAVDTNQVYLIFEALARPKIRKI
jgi:hypothetical protein